MAQLPGMMANKKVMEDPRLKDMGDMPFDGARMILGGFEILLQTGGG